MATSGGWGELLRRKLRRAGVRSGDGVDWFLTPRYQEGVLIQKCAVSKRAREASS